MKNILIITAVLFCSTLNAQYIISDSPNRGEIEVVSESQGMEFSFPILETPYNLSNPPSFKYHYFGKDSTTKNEKGEVKSIEIKKSFDGINDFLEREGYKSLDELKKQGLKVFYILPVKEK